MNSRYRDCELLAQTEQIRISKAFDTQTNQSVLIKKIDPCAALVWREQAEREAEVLRRLPSGPFPKLVEFEQDVSGCQLVETFLEGESLTRWLKRKPDSAQKKRIFLQILKTIQNVHQSGFLYLDLKASNILVHENQAALVDFNACLPIGSCRPILVNRNSLPPEGLKGKPMDERADQIGLGSLYLKMFGPSPIAFQALAADPEKRFVSLEALKKAIQTEHKANRRQALLCLLVALAVGFAGIAVFHRKPIDDPIPNAAQIAQFTDLEWEQTAFQALEDNHLPLARALLTNVPNTNSFPELKARLLLHQMCGTRPDQETIEALEQALSIHPYGLMALADLCPTLENLSLGLSAELVEELMRSDELARLTPAQIRKLSSWMVFLIYAKQEVPIPDDRFVQLSERYAPELVLSLQKGLLFREKGSDET